MSEEMAGFETGENILAESLEDVAAGGGEDEILEGVIINGTWVNPAVAADDPRRQPRQAQFDYARTEGPPSFMRMIFGSMVIFSEEVTERARLSEEENPPLEMIEAAVHQALSQEQSIDDRPFSNLRYGTIGFISGLMDNAQGGVGRLSNLGDSAARATGQIISPIWNSALFAPFHQPAIRAEQAGADAVNKWIERGRIEEVRSRALAEVSINNLVEESVTEITNNTQVQTIVQEVIASQSTSIVQEIIEEARERLVSLDILVMGKLNRNLAPAPDFRPAYLSTLSERRVRYQRRNLANSLAGTYAGPVSRLVAFLVDVLVLIVALAVVSTFISSTLNLFGLTTQVRNFLESGSTLATIAVLILASFNFLMLSAYFVFSWDWVGATFGDILIGLRVVNTQGGSISFIRSIMRLIGYYISAFVFLLGFIWALFDRRRQGWQDKLGGSFVLYDWPAHPDENFLNDEVMSEIAEGDSS
jgi:uncharacterized RDD family membrane protein YckC